MSSREFQNLNLKNSMTAIHNIYLKSIDCRMPHSYLKEYQFLPHQAENCNSHRKMVLYGYAGRVGVTGGGG